VFIVCRFLASAGNFANVFISVTKHPAFFHRRPGVFSCFNFALPARLRRGKQEDDHNSSNGQENQTSASASVAASASTAATAAGFPEAPLKRLLVVRIAGCAFSEVAVIICHMRLLSPQRHATLCGAISSAPS
jgi:hypothetical protein